MYAWVKLDVSSIPLRSLSGCAVRVFLALLTCLREDGTAAVSYKSLSESLAISRRSAIRAINELEQANILARTNGVGQILTVYIKRGAAVGRASIPSADYVGFPSQFSLQGGDKI